MSPEVGQLIVKSVMADGQAAAGSLAALNLANPRPGGIATELGPPTWHVTCHSYPT